jgi:hypothetical protein
VKFDDRRPERQKRGSTRNESCGLGGNEPPKPRLKKKEDSTPVRKPRLSPKRPKPAEKRETMEPGKIREPKPKGMSLNDPVKMLEEFNILVNKMALAGIDIVEEAGGFSAVEKSQQELLGKLKDLGESLPPELSESFELLAKTTRSSKYVQKVPVKNPKPGGRKFRYIYGT